MKYCKIGLWSITLLIFSGLFVVASCGNREDTVNCFPQSHIYVTLNLNLPAYYSLQNAGGWIYVNEQGSGTRGLIVVRTSGGFKVYDRNAPHICPGTDTTLNVVNSIKLVCPKDGAEWILITGQPTAVAKTQPKTYPYHLDENSGVLSIFN